MSIANAFPLMHDLLSLSMDDQQKIQHFKELSKIREQEATKSKQKGKSSSTSEGISDAEREEGFINAVDKLR